MKSTRERLAWLWSYWRPHWRFGLFLLLFTVVASVVTVAFPLVMRSVVDGMVLIVPYNLDFYLIFNA